MSGPHARLAARMSCCDEARARGLKKCGACHACLLSPMERFRQSYEACPETGCWVWTRSLDSSGYGRIRAGGRLVSAHRFAFEQLRTGIPKGAQLDHLCRNRACCNPDHLEVVTSRENSMRSTISQAFLNATKLLCKNGHPLDGRQRSGRRCRVCDAAAKRRYKERARAAR